MFILGKLKDAVGMQYIFLLWVGKECQDAPELVGTGETSNDYQVLQPAPNMDSMDALPT